MIIDMHGHYHPRSYLEALARIGPGGRPLGNHPETDDEAHIQERLEMMEQAGVGMQVLSPAAGRAPYTGDEGLAIGAARLVNDLDAALVNRYPDKFKAYVSLPLPHIDASLRELERGLDALGMVGVNMHISALDRSVAEDEFLPLYEEIDRRHGMIFYHPCGNGICSPLITDYGFSGAVGTSMEDTVIALHLIAKKIPSRYPNITYIIPHLGGLIPMLLQRLDNQFSMGQHNLPEPPSVTARRSTTTPLATARMRRSPALGKRSGPTTSCRAVIFRCCSPLKPTREPSRGFARRDCRSRTSSRS